MTSLALLPLLALAVTALGVAYLLMRAAPRASFVLWCVTLFFVPVWVGVSVGFFWAAITGVTLLAVLAGEVRFRVTVFDVVLGAFTVLVIGLFVIGMVTIGGAVQAVLEWVLPYAWGRVLLTRVSREWVCSVLGGFAVVAATLALVEAATGVNVFLSFPAMNTSAYEIWGILQDRGGMVRVEGAFGHSIALGATLAMCSAFLLATRWPTPVKMIGLGAIAAATVLTFSRIGLVTLVLSATLTVLLLPRLSRSTRAAVVAGGAVAALVAVPILSDVFLEAGDEASGSANYRLDLLALVPQLRPFGSAGDWQGLVAGGTYLGAYASSIDNALLVMAVRLGWVPTALLCVVLLGVAWWALRRRRSSPAAIAVAAQLPGLLAVALITQFGMFFWFLVGLAVTWPGSPRETGGVESGIGTAHAAVEKQEAPVTRTIARPSAGAVRPAYPTTDGTAQ